jgi:hypothetical protein
MSPSLFNLPLAMFLILKRERRGRAGILVKANLRYYCLSVLSHYPRRMICSYHLMAPLSPWRSAEQSALNEQLWGWAGNLTHRR